MELTREERIAGAEAAEHWTPGMAHIWMLLPDNMIMDAIQVISYLKKQLEDFVYG